MCACFPSMHHDFTAASMCCEAAASFCVILLLGSAILAESIFVSVILVLALIRQNHLLTAR